MLRWAPFAHLPLHQRDNGVKVVAGTRGLRSGSEVSASKKARWSHTHTYTHTYLRLLGQVQQAPLALGELHLVVRNTARTHQFRLDATPPPEWGQRLSLRCLWCASASHRCSSEPARDHCRRQPLQYCLAHQPQHCPSR